MSASSFTRLIDTTAKEAENVGMSFFRHIDKQASAPAQVQAQTTIVWNGTPLVGPVAFEQMIKQTPRMSHKLSGMDVQPFPNGDAQMLNMNVSLTGAVTFGDQKSRADEFGFVSQMIVRRTAPGADLVVQTMAYRLVHKPTNSLLRT